MLKKGKRTLFVILAIMIASLLAISCDTGSPQVAEEELTILVPSFSETSSSRGLTDMFNGNDYFSCFNDPYRNLYLSYGVMTTTPITPSLRPISNVHLTTSSLDSLKLTLGFTSYGFSVEVADIGYNLQAGNIMIKYNIIESGEVVGVVDYVYNWQKKTFSYREAVMLTLFGNEIPPQAYTFGAMVLEMHDVPFETVLGVPTGAYSTGKLTNGTLERNAWVDFIQVVGITFNNNNGNREFHHDIVMDRSYLTIASKGGQIYSMSPLGDNLAFHQPIEDLDNGNPVRTRLCESFIIPKTESEIEELDHYNWASGYSGFYNWNAISPSSFGMDFLYDVTDLAYDNSEILRADGLTDLSEPLQFRSDANHTDTQDMFTAYNVNTKTGASIQLIGNKQLKYIINNEVYDYCNFNSFDSGTYRSYANGVGIKEIRHGLIEDQLKACGINNANFIENYKTAFDYYCLFGLTLDQLTVTTENPATFKARLDGIVAPLKSGRLIVELKNLQIHQGNHVIEANSNGSISGTTTIGAMFQFNYEIRYSTTDYSITSFTVLSDGNEAKNQLTYLSLPDNVPSVSEDVFTDTNFPNLEYIEVSSTFDASNIVGTNVIRRN